MFRDRSPLLLLATILALLPAPACEISGPGATQGPGWRRTRPPEPGLPRFQRLGAIPVPGGVVNGAAGNLMLRRVDLSIDTRLGTREVAATYNSARRDWIWSFQMRFEGLNFTDPEGGLAVRDGHGSTPIRAGDWIWHDESEIRSAGGLIHAFDAEGRLEAVHWLSGPYPRLEYLAEEIAGRERTTSVRQCRSAGLCEPVYTIEYDAEGRVSALEDRTGRRAEFAWDEDGSLVEARDALDLARGWPGFRYEYASPGLLYAQTSSEGERIQYSLGERRGMVKTVKHVGDFGRHRFIFGKDHVMTPEDEPDWWTLHLAPDGERTIYRYDDLRRLRTLIRRNLDTTTWDWNGYEVSEWVQPDGSTTEWERVGDDEILRREPGGNEVRILFPADGGENRQQPRRRATLRVTDSLGTVEERHYQGERLVWIENGAGERTTIAYDAENQIASVTRPSGLATVYEEYGEHGHAERVTFAGETELRTYDGVGNLLRSDGLALRDFRRPGEVERRYDEDRNVSEIVMADAPAVGPAALHGLVFSRGSDGRTTRIERPFGGDHELIYDGAGRLVERRERVDGAWQATAFARDVRHRVTAVTLPNGMRRELEYDSIGRVRTLRTLRDGAVEHEAALAYQDGRLHTVSDVDATGPESYEWDGEGRPVAVTFPDGERLELAWDPRGRRTQEVYRLAGGSLLRTLDFGHDGANRPTTLHDDGALVHQRDYLDGRLDQASFGNGLVRTVAYDPVSGLPSATLLDHPVHGVVAATTITLQAAPAPDGASLSVQSAVGPASSQEEYLLGPLGAGGPRVVAWGDGVDTHAAAYDALGNLAASAAGDHVYNAEANRLLRIDAPDGSLHMDYEHDAAGFVTRRGGETIAWTAHGRIAAVGTRAELEWDALGRPTRRRIESDERRFGFGGRVETDAAGVPLRIDLDAVVLELASGERRYRHTDLRGNVQLVSDDTGQVVAQYRYDAYGVASLSGADDGAATFARGRALGDLVVLGPRLHDPLSGRFLAPDPLFQDVSQHTYAGGNPVWWWDRSGAHPEQIDAAEVSRTASELEAEAAAGEDLVMVGKGFTFVAALAATVSTAAGGWIAAIGGGALVAGWSQKNTANRKKQAFVNFVATTQSQHSPNPSKGSGTQPQPCAASCGTGPAGAETGNSLSPGRTAFPSGYWRGFGW